MKAIDWTDLIKKYKGKWVALADDEVTVLAYDNDIHEVVKSAAKLGFTKPTLFKVPESNVAFIGQS